MTKLVIKHLSANRLPYLEAVISEVIRINSIAPLTAPHRTTEDVEINGYTIPKVSALSTQSMSNVQLELA